MKNESPVAKIQFGTNLEGRRKRIDFETISINIFYSGTSNLKQAKGVNKDNPIQYT